MNQLHDIATKLVADHKGLLAADQSPGSIEKSLFRLIGLDNTESNRRNYRQLLATSDDADYISGYILHEETWKQSLDDGRSFIEALKAKGILPGMKVDAGMHVIGGSQHEEVTHGFDGLGERLEHFAAQGAAFTKWRAAIRIDQTKGWPSDLCIELNSHGLARYAALVQQAGMVPIVEPEVLMDGDFSMEHYAEQTARVQRRVFALLAEYGVDLAGIILKPNMIVPSKNSGEPFEYSTIAELTLQVLRDTVPAQVPGIMFLSGGQTVDQARESLRAINQAAQNAPWTLSFSYGRALQTDALQAWQGKPDRIAAGQTAYVKAAQGFAAVVQ